VCVCEEEHIIFLSTQDKKGFISFETHLMTDMYENDYPDMHEVEEDCFGDIDTFYCRKCKTCLHNYRLSISNRIKTMIAINKSDDITGNIRSKLFKRRNTASVPRPRVK
jgi:hypothetical protein